MTREESIKRLDEQAFKELEKGHWVEDIINGKALEQKPDIRLKALMKNLKDRDWNVNAVYKIDEVEARGIIEAIENMEEKTGE